MGPVKRKVLVIDDQEGIGTLFKQNLPQMGSYEVQACKSGKDGIILAKHFKPDIIFLDVVMPGMGGPDIVEILQEDPETASIPIIFITGLVQEYDLRPGSHQIGGREFLPKPFQLSQVVKTIERALSTKKNQFDSPSE